MSALTELGHFYGSLRLARDILIGGVLTQPWWDVQPFSADPNPANRVLGTIRSGSQSEPDRFRRDD